MVSGRTTRSEQHRIAARTPPAIAATVSHVDQTEHDVDVLVTEHGEADLRGLSPKRRARGIIDHCAHRDSRPGLQDYLGRAARASSGQHTPHLIDEALSWYARYVAVQAIRL